VNVENALLALTKCSDIQEATGLDQQTLLRKLSMPWTAEFAFGECEHLDAGLPCTSNRLLAVQRSSHYESIVRGDGLSPLLKISPALMHIENISQQSLARSVRGVGVADLRGALEGRNSMSNANLNRPPSLSTLEHASSTSEGILRLTQTRSRNKQHSTAGRRPGEVREVLHKLGIGKNGSLLKASFPSLQKSDHQ